MYSVVLWNLYELLDSLSEIFFWQPTVDIIPSKERIHVFSCTHYTVLTVLTLLTRFSVVVVNAMKVLSSQSFTVMTDVYLYTDFGGTRVPISHARSRIN